MLHFPSALKPNGPTGLPRRTDSLNATQRKFGSDPVFLQIEEELHDARRVKAHGQEEDLRLALDMVINRVTELSSLLSEAYKTQADLEVQLNVAKSNLALVISNNEMLEDALRRDSSRNTKEIGWQRRSVRDGEPVHDRKSLDEWQQSLDLSTGNENTPPSAVVSPQTAASNAATQESGRFFRFRFTPASPSSRPASRPSTPSTSSHQLSSPTNTVIPPRVTKEIEDLNSDLEKERSARKTAEQDKAALEAELESLSQALFEEANKMVATERIKLAEVEEELNELRVEKEALQRALRLIEGENQTLRRRTSPVRPVQSVGDDSRSRTSSEIAIKSRPSSFILESTYPLPESPSPEMIDIVVPTLPNSSDTAQSDTFQTTVESSHTLTSLPTEMEGSSPWADIPSPTTSPPNPGPIHPRSSFFGAAVLTGS